MQVPLVTAFATVNSTAPSTTPLDTLRLYLGFWSVVYDGLAPPADRSVAVSVTASLPRTAASAAVGGATTATVWIIDEGHVRQLRHRFRPSFFIFFFGLSRVFKHNTAHTRRGICSFFIFFFFESYYLYRGDQVLIRPCNPM